jgi:hypothetical protein
VWPMALPLAYHLPWLIESARWGVLRCTWPLTNLSQFAYRCGIRCNVWYASPGRKWEARAKDSGSTTVATFLPYTMPLCAEDFKSQRGEFMHSGHGLRRFSAWFLLIFRTLRLPTVARNSSSLSSHHYSISSRTSIWCLCSRFLATFGHFGVWWLLTAESSLSGACPTTNTQRSI